MASLMLWSSLLFWATPVAAQTPTPAFPGAEGFGAQAKGGRGGKVIQVTNLKDSGWGSLRACIEASGPRTCVFRTGGTIVLETRLEIRNPYLTIAGQTAPGGGIAIRNALDNYKESIRIYTHDVIIRYIRVRPGPSEKKMSEIVNALNIGNEDEKVYDIIIDHSSFSWGTDENVATWYKTRDVTIQWSIISEGLNCSTHAERTCYARGLGDDGHSKGLLIGSAEAGNISIHHNLLAHNTDRNPLIKTGDDINEVVNNVIYNSESYPINFESEYDTQRANVINNYIKDGANSESFIKYDVDLGVDSDIYVRGNIGPHRPDDSLDDHLSVNPIKRFFLATTQHNTLPITTMSAQKAYTQVLAQAGATLPRRDAVDQRIVAEVISGMGKIIDSPSERLLSPEGRIYLTRPDYTRHGIIDPIDDDGWPILERGTPYLDVDHDGMADEWERRYFGNLDRGHPDNSGRFDADDDGYTDLEEFLNGTDPKSAVGALSIFCDSNLTFLPVIVSHTVVYTADRTSEPPHLPSGGWPCRGIEGRQLQEGPGVCPESIGLLTEESSPVG